MITDRRNSTYSFQEPSAIDRAIATNFRSFLTNGIMRHSVLSELVRLQFGVGTLGNAQMSPLASVEFGDQDVTHFGEVIQDGLLDLIATDQLSAASTTLVALSTTVQARLFVDVDRFAENVVLRPATISNASEMINRIGVIGINSILEVDIYGHVNSTHVNGTHVMNGIGGSGDFKRNSLLSIVVLGSTVIEGDISQVVPMVPHIDHTEHDNPILVRPSLTVSISDVYSAKRIGSCRVMMLVPW